jgi:fatty acid desaturase
LADPDQPRRPVRDREVVLAAVLVVAFVLAVAWLSGLIPEVDSAIWRAPLVIVGLIVVTVFVLARALIPRRG